MRVLLFILIFIPFAVFGQDEKLDKPSDGKMNLEHADNTTKRPAEKKEGRKKQKDDIVYTGNVKFTIGGNTLTCDSAVSYENDGTLFAYNVKITYPASFTITGKVLNFNRETARATLTTDVTVTALNGNKVGTSPVFEFDFNYDRYRITSGIITPPDDKQ